MSIKVNNITKVYGIQKALDNVSFEIHPGEIVGLLGPNGAGKSTIMKILTCFIPPTSGDATVCGFDIFDQSIEVRRKIGYLPENNPLYLDLYVKEYLEFMAGIRNQKSKVKSQNLKIVRHPASGIQNPESLTSSISPALKPSSTKRSGPFPKASGSAWVWRRRCCMTPKC
jgi:ABC-type multidrug transport system ATPase subunit